MEAKVLFNEEQRFKQWWLWLILIAVALYFIYGFVQQIFIGKPFGDHPVSDLGVTLLLLVPFGILWLFWKVKLITKICTDGIYYQYFPFHWKFHKIAWEDVEKSYMRTYKPIVEYGGWGLRSGVFGSGQAFNVYGNIGLQLELKNRKKLLIGTQKKYEIEKALEQIKRNQSLDHE